MLIILTWKKKRGRKGQKKKKEKKQKMKTSIHWDETKTIKMSFLDSVDQGFKRSSDSGFCSGLEVTMNVF